MEISKQPTEMSNTLTYQDGIIEGRLIENGFQSIGNSMFYNRIGQTIYLVISAPIVGKCNLEIYSNSPLQLGEINLIDYVELARNNAREELFVSGEIHDILRVYRLYKDN